MRTGTELQGLVCFETAEVDQLKFGLWKIKLMRGGADGSWADQTVHIASSSATPKVGR